MKKIVKFIKDLVRALPIIWRCGFEFFIRDRLTLAFNRWYAEEILKKEIELAKRRNHPFSIALFDIDDFGDINNEMGHSAGDEALRITAALLVDNSRDSDVVVARMGEKGDEFLVGMPGTNEAGAKEFARRVIEILGEFALYLSFGVASLEENQSLEELIDEADANMYRDKKSKYSG